MSDEVISIIDVKLVIHSNEEWWMGSMLEPGKINFVHFYFEIPLRLLNGKVKKKNGIRYIDLELRIQKGELGI